MARIHLFEFEDLSWFPKTIRNYGTDFLQHITNKFDYYKDVAPLIVHTIKHQQTNQIVDLGSGGGGAWKSLIPHITKEIPNFKLVLTDLYPNLKAFKTLSNQFPDHVSFEIEGVSALNVPESLNGVRTQFLSFHHFKPEQAKQILQNAVDCNKAICIFEGQKRDLSHFLKNLFSPIALFIFTPFIRPFSWKRLLFTYIIPVVPLFVWWDGLVSVLRTYSEKEMTALVQSLNQYDKFSWQIGTKKSRGISVPYLIGIPLNN